MAAAAPELSRLAENTRQAHDGLASLSGSGSATGHPAAESAFEEMVEAWRNVTNQFAHAIHEFADATGSAAELYTESDTSSMVLSPVAKPEPDDTPILWGP